MCYTVISQKSVEAVSMPTVQIDLPEEPLLSLKETPESFILDQAEG